jgi:hypothetical protein
MFCINDHTRKQIIVSLGIEEEYQNQIPKRVLEMIVCIEPCKADIVGLNSECMAILEQVGWGKFFELFTGHNEGITRAFAHSFDDKFVEVGNLTLHLSEKSFAQMLNLPQTREK